MKHAVHTDQAPQAIGPYSQAIQAGPFLYMSGQLPINSETGHLISNDVDFQAQQVLQNMESILSAAGYTMDDVIKVHVYLKDMSDFKVVNEIYAKFFKAPYPARVAVEVSRLPLDVKVEMDCIAYK